MAGSEDQAKLAADKDAGATPKKRWGVKRFFRKVYKICSSHVGLIILLILYSFMGAAIFRAIEGPHETQEKEEIQEVRDEVIVSVWNTTFAVKRNEAAFKQLMTQELKKYESKLYDAFSHGINTQSETVVWDFWGAMFFAATIYTTIGKPLLLFIHLFITFIYHIILYQNLGYLRVTNLLPPVLTTGSPKAASCVIMSM